MKTQLLLDLFPAAFVSSAGAHANEAHVDSVSAMAWHWAASPDALEWSVRRKAMFAKTKAANVVEARSRLNASRKRVTVGVTGTGGILK